MIKRLTSKLLALLLSLAIAIGIMPMTAFAVVQIAVASATVEAPVAGSKPDMSATVGEVNAGYDVSVTGWFLCEGTSYQRMNINEVFEIGKNYAVNIVFSEKEGYAFSDSTTYKINGQNAPGYATGEKEIRFVAVEAITNVSGTVGKLSAGVKPVYLPVTSGEPDIYSLTLDYCQLAETPFPVLDPSDEFEGGKTYTVVLNINPKPGYGISESTTTNINGRNLNIIDGKIKLVTYVPIPITDPTATVTEPIVGATPDMTAVPGDSDKYSTSVSGWYLYDGTRYWEMDSTDIFEIGKTYAVNVHFTPQPDYDVPISATAKINGNDSETFANGDRQVMFTANQAISAVYGTVTMPADGEHPDMSVTSADSDKYTFSLNYWWLLESPYTQLSSTDVFQGGCTYAVNCSINPKPGYAFTDSTKFFLNGFEYPLIEGNLSVAFNVGTAVTNIGAQISTPISGNSPSTLVNSNNSNLYSVTNEYWLDENGDKMNAADTFIAGKTYSVVLRFTPKYGYCFNNTTTATICDLPAVRVATDDPNIYLYKQDFTILSGVISGKAYSLDITDLTIPAHGVAADYTASVANTGFTVSAILYAIGGTTADPYTGTAGDVVSIGVRIRADDGYSFASTSELSGTWNSMLSAAVIKTAREADNERLFIFRYTVPEPTELTFTDNTVYNIPDGIVGSTYTTTTAFTAYGGIAPHSFTLETPVAGLSINSENKLVYTRPAVATAKTATIKVTDSTGASKTITVAIGAVTTASASSTTVSGTVSSFGSDETVKTYVHLYRGHGDSMAAEPTYETEVTGVGIKAYSINSVSAGDYTLVVSKQNHFTKEYEITVGGTPVTQNTELLLLGDVDLNGICDARDCMKAELVRSGNLTPPSSAQRNYDVDRNGVYDNQDFQRIVYYSVNKR